MEWKIEKDGMENRKRWNGKWKTWNGKQWRNVCVGF
jgi:hypothetical protein